jgi:hypothetical protein
MQTAGEWDGDNGVGSAVGVAMAHSQTKAEGIWNLRNGWEEEEEEEEEEDRD